MCWFNPMGCFRSHADVKGIKEVDYPESPTGPMLHCEVANPGKQKPQPFGVPALSFNLIMQLTGDFQEDFQIGEGSHSIVYRAVLSGRDVAIKRLHISLRDISHNEFLEQVSFASRLKHDNFVELLGYCIEGSVRFLAYEFANQGSLHDVLHGKKLDGYPQPAPPLNWIQRVRIAVDAAKGLEYLHEKNNPSIVHGEIRSSSILLFDDYKAKIADFDLSNEAADTTERFVSVNVLGSFGYNAPEYTMNFQLTQKSDVYSFGVVLLELLTGRKVIDQSRPLREQSLVTWALPRITEYNVEECVDPRLRGRYPIDRIVKFAVVAAACLTFEPEGRPSMTAVVNALQALLRQRPNSAASSTSTHPWSVAPVLRHSARVP